MSIKLLNIKPAPVSNTSAIAISETTSAPRSRWRRAVAVGPPRLRKSRTLSPVALDGGHEIQTEFPSLHPAAAQTLSTYHRFESHPGGALQRREQGQQSTCTPISQAEFRQRSRTTTDSALSVRSCRITRHGWRPTRCALRFHAVSTSLASKANWQRLRMR